MISSYTIKRNVSIFHKRIEESIVDAEVIEETEEKENKTKKAKAKTKKKKD